MTNAVRSRVVGAWSALVAVILLGLMLLPLAASAQQQAQSEYFEYRFKRPGNLWSVINTACGTTEANQWEKYLEMPQNAALNTVPAGYTTRAFTTPRGQRGWLVLPGDVLTLPSSTCREIAETADVVPITLQRETAATPNSPITVMGTSPVGTSVPVWMWLLIALLVALVAWLTARKLAAQDALVASMKHQREVAEERKRTDDALQGTIAALSRENNTLHHTQERLNEAHDLVEETLLDALMEARSAKGADEDAGVFGVPLPGIGVIGLRQTRSHVNHVAPSQTVPTISLTVTTGDESPVTVQVANGSQNTNAREGQPTRARGEQDHLRELFDEHLNKQQ